MQLQDFHPSVRPSESTTTLAMAYGTASAQGENVTGGLQSTKTGGGIMQGLAVVAAAAVVLVAVCAALPGPAPASAAFVNGGIFGKRANHVPYTFGKRANQIPYMFRRATQLPMFLHKRAYDNGGENFDKCAAMLDSCLARLGDLSTKVDGNDVFEPRPDDNSL